MKNDIRKIARKEILELEPYVSARDLYKKADVFLDANENPYGKGGLNRYPDSDQLKLRMAIAKYAGSGINWKNIIVGNGSDELLDLSMRVFAAKGDNVICTYPEYAMYKVQAAVNGVRLKEIDLDDEFRLDVDLILKQVDSRTKMILFSSPNSPTGTEQSVNEIERLAKGTDAVIFVDEAYFEFSNRSAVNLVKKYPNVIVSRTFSKAWGLAGARVGYVIASKSVIELIRKVKLPYNVSNLSTSAVLKTLKNQGAMRSNVKKIIKSREELSLRLRELGSEVLASKTNFILCRFPRWQNAVEVQKTLVERGIVLRDFSKKRGLDNCVRITIGNPAENKKLVDALSDIFKNSFDAIFFDIDDTLIDVSKSYIEDIKQTAQIISGKKISIAQVYAVKGLLGMNGDWDATIEVLRQNGIKSSREQVGPIFQRLYLGNSKNKGLVAKEKVLVDMKLLLKLQKQGKKIGLVTGRPRKEALIALKMLGLPSGMTLVVLEDTKKGKPDPAPLILAKKISGAKCPVYVGDSVSDREAARRAGFGFVGIGKGSKMDGEIARFSDVNTAIKRLFV